MNTIYKIFHTKWIKKECSHLCIFCKHKKVCLPDMIGVDRMDKESRRIEFIDECVKIRENLGVKKSEVAKAFGIDRAVISRFEKGKYNSLDLYLFYMNLEDNVNEKTRNS